MKQSNDVSRSDILLLAVKSFINSVDQVGQPRSWNVETES